MIDLQRMNDDYDRLAKAVQMLSEHFDCIQIVACKQNPDDQEETVAFKEGAGNIYARVAMCHEFAAGMEARWIESFGIDTTPEGE